MSSKKSKSSGSKPSMAAHNASVAQNSVNERRLRPVYDYLDNGNNKKALQEADKVLKKQPDFPCCKVLKALALMRMGKEAEAQPLIDSVLDEAPTDESTLQAMNIGYKELQQPEKICTMYENAVKKDPANEEFLSHLFMAHVRLGNYKRQQQIAMALYKAKPKTPYYFWAVMSVVLQATTSGDEKLSASVTLPLAERMIANMDKDNKMKQEQETRLYLMVLEFQHKFKEALDILDGPLGEQLEQQTSHLDLVEHKKMEYLKKLDKWDQVYTLSLKLLQKSEDHWSLYLDFITSVFRLVDSEDSQGLI